MTNEAASKPHDLRAQINRSGLVFQLAVEWAIRAREREHGWRVLSSEHAWQTKDGRSGYADLVLAKDDAPYGQRIVIECKRRQEKNWFFLCPREETTQPIEGVKALFALVMKRRTPSPTSSFPSLRLEVDWDERRLHPASHQARFCTREKDELLEATARNLLLATEAVAEEELALEAKRKQFSITHYLPMIVTNAPLFVCRFDASDLALLDGLLTGGSEEFEEVAFLRLRKTFALPSTSEQLVGTDLGDLNSDREQTMLIASARHINEVLDDLRFVGDSPPWSKVKHIVAEEA